MIRTVLWVSWLNMRRDRVAQLMTFILPIAFFSIFASVFSSQRNPTERLYIGVADEDRSPASREFIAALRRDSSLRIETSRPRQTEPLTRETALEMVRAGRPTVALVIPPGFGERFGDFSPGGAEVELLADTSDPLGAPMASGLLQRAAMSVSPALLMRHGLRQFEQYIGLTDGQKLAAEQIMKQLAALPESDSAAGTDSNAADSSPATAEGASEGAPAAIGGPLRVRTVDVMSDARRTRSPAIAFNAAGIGVMFLLFMASGAGGSLLEEEEHGTLERVLGSRIGMTHLLLGKWAFISLLGMVQVTVMFLWGWAVFGLDLFTPLHLTGFAIMTFFTAASAASFGLLLAALCRSRAQLSGVATVLVLMMSALGGSMFPRFMMPEFMQQIGWFTFNAWALEGYQNVFWRDLPPIRLLPSVAVLSGLCVVFLVVARLLARRWERI